MIQTELSATIRRAFELFKSHLLKIFILALIIYIPISVMQLMLPDLDLSEVTQDNLASYYEKLMILLLSTALLSLVSGLFDMSVIYFVREADKPVPATLSEAFDFSIRRFPRYLATRSIGFALGFLLAMLCFLPGIIALLLFSLSPYILVLRESWGRRALKESSLLVRKNALFVIIVLLIQYGAAYLISFAISLVMELLEKVGLASLAVDIIWTATDVILYTVLSVITIFIALVTQRMINSSPELDKDPEPAP